MKDAFSDLSDPGMRLSMVTSTTASFRALSLERELESELELSRVE